ncbi:alpha-tubulin N-acetyltransferase isoform X1 [Nasonia vitripennis]|uniref:Alpha-tubulin N-acetyltransferase n=2 Tax=Nasonia vitripennis TaxID=7425 RepID=A0A7M7IQ22_NASVI|nr:alpha-tubulin N-acetyltransferase isoform X1 [Nasonia vitripennis]XP_016840960.1 alpha-tubulin N-acetyltransferase isoform X1 [Nasonia vitripennis]XP_031786855.1 alpha-tubulin N-acetyltransferase isoform X1 [Nasonia vitripennis]
MDFRFDINKLLPKRINKITHTLIPEGFRGDRREYNDCQRLLTRILDDMGEASAKAQGLNRTITSALKLRDTDHIIYLMVDNEGNNGLGSVVGLLKTGSKLLFMFDENGRHYQIKPRCILDFYIHESRQRMGLGMELYQHMLSEENLKPIKLAIDRPSDKFLSFLMKHYGLTTIIPQNNKFVVFKGFFDDEIEESQSSNNRNNSASPTRQSVDGNNQTNLTDIQSPRNNSSNGTPRSAYGRYAASRPPCSMATIIHHAVTDQPANTKSSLRMFPDRPDSVTFSNYEKQEKETTEIEDGNDSITIAETMVEDMHIHEDNDNETVFSQPEGVTDDVKDELEETPEALAEANDNDKIDSAISVAGSEEVPVDENALTSAGHLDLKFYHSPLW